MDIDLTPEELQLTINALKVQQKEASARSKQPNPHFAGHYVRRVEEYDELIAKFQKLYVSTEL